MVTKEKLIKIDSKIESEVKSFEGWRWLEKPITVDGIKLETQEVYGGGEGDGEEHWVVIRAEDEDGVSFWEIPGWYSSAQGSELEFYNIFKVKSVQKLVDVWEAENE